MIEMCEKTLKKLPTSHRRWVDGSVCALTMTMTRATTTRAAAATAATIFGAGFFCLGVDVQQFPLLGHGVTCAKKEHSEL